MVLWWVIWGLIGVAVAVGLRMVLVGLWWRPTRLADYFAKQGIRGPPYKFLVGNVKEVVELMLKASNHPMPSLSHNILPRVFSFYHHWKKIYGGTFLVWFGPRARIMISDPDLIREIFVTKSECYEKIEANALIKQLEGDGLISLKGDKWAHHRKIITPTFHMDNLKLLVPEVAKSVTEMMEKWTALEDGRNGEVEVEVGEWYQSLTEDVITRMAFGSRYLNEGKAIFRLQSRQMSLAAEAYQKVLFPGYRFLPTKRNLKSWKLDKQTRRSLIKLIEKKKQYLTLQEEAGGPGPKDLLGLMIQAGINQNNINSPELLLNNNNCGMSPSKITVQDIVEECKSFFFAGKQTTSNLLTWTTVLLAMHPQWQDLAREEVLRVCGSRDIPTKDDLVKLKMLSMILNESLRLYPPAIATIRRSKFDLDLGGYKIPHGTELLVPILAVHHDKAIWGDDANEFNPMRFAYGVSRAAKHPAAFIPFGLGMRTCVGQNLAILQAKLVISIILQRFSFTLSPSYQHAPTVLMLLYPQHGAPVIFRRLPDSYSPPS